MTWSMDPCWGAGCRMLVTRAGGWLTGWVTGWLADSLAGKRPARYRSIYNGMYACSDCHPSPYISKSI